MAKASTDSPLRIGIAFSGGADSVALSWMLAKHRGIARSKVKLDFSRAEFHLLHVDHGVDCGEGPDAVAFARSFAQRSGLALKSAKVAVCPGKGRSVEMAARDARIAQMKKWYRALKLDAIATAHQKDDVSETLLLRLVRGSGARGLSGLRPESEIEGMRVVRPLLDYTHDELCEILERDGVEWREDPTNVDLSIKRNLIRLKIIPYLERNLDPDIRAHLAQSAEILREEDAKSELAVKRRMAHATLIASGRPAGFEEVEKFVLTIDRAKGYRPSTEAECHLSAKALSGRRIEFRLWRDGDRIAPIGLNGSKKLQDVFTSMKISPEKRRQLPILADAGTGEVLWVPGYRVSRSVAVESPDADSFVFKKS